MGTLTRAVVGARKGLSIYAQRNSGMFLGWDGTVIGTNYGLPGERSYARMVGDGRGSNLVVALLNWMMREQPLAPPALWQLPPEGDESLPQVPQIKRRHELLTLLRYPTADPTDRRMRRGYYSGRVLWQASVADYAADGNCYWWKRRDTAGRVRQLWWLPSFCMDPRGAPESLPDSPFIWKYRYTVNGRETLFDPWDIVHTRFGMDPQNPRKGLSPLRALLRELTTDEVAARHTAALLINAGIPGLVIIPGKDVDTSNADGLKETKQRFIEEFGDDRRGEPIVLTYNAEVKQLAWSPEQMQLGNIRDIPEERAAAALGIPAAVVGFGTGLQQVKVGATMDALRLMGWEGAVLPADQAFATEVDAQLLPEFIDDDDELDRTIIDFDFARVPVLLDLQIRRAEVEVRLVGAKIKKRSEARATLGLPVGPGDDVYIANAGVTQDPTPGRPGRAEPTDDEDDEDEEGAAAAR